MSFIDTGVGGPNQLQFVPEQGTDTIYLRFHSPDVINVRELTVEDTRKHPVLGQYVRDDGSLLIGMFYFAPSGQLDFMKIDGGDPGEVQVSASANGPFVDLPMTVQTMRKTFGPPKSIAYAEVNR